VKLQWTVKGFVTLARGSREEIYEEWQSLAHDEAQTALDKLVAELRKKRGFRAIDVLAMGTGTDPRSGTWRSMLRHQETK